MHIAIHLFFNDFPPTSLNFKLRPATGVTTHLDEWGKIREANYLYIIIILSLFENDCRLD